MALLMGFNLWLAQVSFLSLVVNFYILVAIFLLLPLNKICCQVHILTSLLIYIYIHTYIPWIRKHAAKIKGCGTNNKYTNIYNFYSIQYYTH